MRGMVHEVRIDRDKCTRHECCIHVCPEVFELDATEAIASVKSGAEAFYNSHAGQIIQAARECPTGAIEAAVDRSSPPPDPGREAGG